MQRLIEQPADEGDVFDRRLRLGRVHYHLSIYQHFPEAGDEPVPPDLEVEGHITPIGQLRLAELHERGSELTLRLADGRALDFSITNPDGAIHSTGRSLYRQRRSATSRKKLPAPDIVPPEEHSQEIEFMPDTIRTVDYFYMLVPQKPGEGANILRALKEAGVNLLAFSGFPEGRRAQLDFIPADAAAFKHVAKANKWKIVGPKRGFLIQGDDRVGAIADIVGRLADAKINIVAIDAVSANGRYGALCWVAPREVRKAAQVLNAS